MSAPHARLKAGSPEFSVMIGSYITAFDSLCRAALPANKVDVMKTECARETYPVNSYGQRIGNSTCVEYRAVPSGVYAAPDLYAAQQSVEREVAARTGAKLLANPGAGFGSVCGIVAAPKGALLGWKQTGRTTRRSAFRELRALERHSAVCLRTERGSARATNRANLVTHASRVGSPR